MNEIVNQLLLTGYKFIPKLHLRPPAFTYRAGEPFSKHGEETKKCKETGNLKHIYQSESEKVCFAYDAAYSASKYLAKRTI